MTGPDANAAGGGPYGSGGGRPARAAGVTGPARLRAPTGMELGSAAVRLSPDGPRLLAALMVAAYHYAERDGESGAAGGTCRHTGPVVARLPHRRVERPAAPCRAARPRGAQR